MADSVPVAHLLSRCEYGGNLLFHLLEHGQLAKHRFSLCLCRRLARNCVRPQFRWAPTGFHQFLSPDAHRELASICGHALRSSFFCVGDDRSDSHRARTTVRSRNANSLFQSLVFSARSVFGHSDRVACKSFWGCSRSARQSFLCHIVIRNS